MDEKKKLINWVAGISTLIVVLMIFIVVMDRRENGVSRAVAGKTVALTVAGRETMEKNAPETSNFEGEAAGQWYTKYLDYLYENGYLDKETVVPSEESALAAVTYGELAGWIRAASVENAPELQKYLSRGEGKKAGKAVEKNDFWDFYDVFRRVVDVDGNIKEIETDIYGTPNNVETAAPWTAYTGDGKFLFEGLYMDSFIDKKVKLLVRDSDIIKVEQVVSDEIVYQNAWISGFSGNEVTVFAGAVQRKFPVKGVLKDESELTGQIGDLYLKGGKPKKLVLKKERITGTVLSVRENEIEIEGYGYVPLSSDFKIYRTYGVLKEQQKKDILVGYHLQEFVVAGDEICAALTTQRPQIDNIRVLLMNTGFKSLFHSEITLVCDAMAVLEYGDEKEKKSLSVAAGEEITIKSDDARLRNGRMVFRAANEGGTITVNSIERGQGVPSYPGHMEITKEEDGLLLLNEVDLEEYLKRVVPSEMPSNYELEALKAQAVCARTYAWRQIQGNAYSKYGAHVDDSTNYQVYNNTKTFESTDTAVNETFGQLLAYESSPVEAFYYSTSCGHSTDGSVWGADAKNTPYLRAVSINEKAQDLNLTSNDDFGEFIKNTSVEAYDSDASMFRWNLKTTNAVLDEKIGGVGRITGLTITERGPGGIAKALKVVGTEGSKTFTGQSRIRSLLGNKNLTINRNDGGTLDGWDTLPSGFIYIENEGTDDNNVTTFTIYGGGYGHGVGMSQNGAQGMAKAGKTCLDILRFFYNGCEIMDIGDVS